MKILGSVWGKAVDWVLWRVIFFLEQDGSAEVEKAPPGYREWSDQRLAKAKARRGGDG